MVEDVGSLPGPYEPMMIQSAARPDRQKPTKRRSHDGPRRTRIVVLLNSKPRDYLPGTGPPLQRARLLPPQDSTAYILDRILLPSTGPAANGKPLPKRMTYIIGWHDLPAARLLVPAMRILDYVSPYVLEEWECQLEQELEDERAKLKEESNIEKLEQRLMPAKGQTRPRKKKRRVKPPAHSQIEAAAVVDSEAEAQAAARPASGVMSLSTPQRARLEEFEELSEEESTPSRQVEEELLASQKRQRQTILSPQALPESIFGGELTPSKLFATPKVPQSNDELSTMQRQTTLPPLRPDLPVHSNGLTLSFTPIGSSRKHPPVPSSQVDIPERRGEDMPAEKPTKRRKKEEEQPPLDAAGEPVWEVQRLEDAEWFEVEGRGLVRYFKVRWEGDWPPDQNPSWEPEENIPATLVRNYLKNPKRSSKQAKHAVKRKREMLPWAPERKYSSVSEAFAAVDDDDTMDLVGGQHFSDDALHGHDDGKDELFVVEENPDHGRGGASRNGNGAFGSMVSGLFSAYLG